MKEDFTSRFDGLLSAIQGVQGELKALSGRMTRAEVRISTDEDDLTSLKIQTTSMKTAMGELVLKVDDLENRAHRSNLRLVGLTKSTEAADMCACIWKNGFLKCLVNKSFLGQCL